MNNNESTESTGDEWKEKPDDMASIIKDTFSKLYAILGSIGVSTDPAGPAPEGCYILKGEICCKPENYGEFTEFMISGERRIGWDELNPSSTVSTIFLTIDFSHGSGPPLLFETMAWHNNIEFEQKRYSTYEAAVTGHREVLELLKIAVANDM